MSESPSGLEPHAERAAPGTGDDPVRWAGHGHVGAFVFQIGALIAVKLAVWGFIFLLALRLLGEPMPWNW